MSFDPTPAAPVQPRPNVSPTVERLAAWSWRLLVIAAAGFMLLSVLVRLRVVLFPIIIATFLAVILTPVADFFRPNAWPNTPDILHETLQHGGRAAFQARLILAATLSANYGIYGPAFELQEATPREPGSEEYLDSEKYQLQHWELADERSLAPLIAVVNRIRHRHPALQWNERLDFHPIDDDQLLAYTKRSADNRDCVLTIVSLDFRNPRSGTVELSLGWLGLPADAPYEVEDLLAGGVETWRGPRQRLSIDPAVMPARILHLRPADGDAAGGGAPG